MEWNNKKIYFEGVAAKDLADEYGTPLYIYEAGRIRANTARLQKAFVTRYPKFKIFYAVKANTNPHLIQLLLKEGVGCDVASANEIRLAKKCGVAGKDILFSGNNLSVDDFDAAVENQVLCNLDDITLLDPLLKRTTPPMISFRINPGIGKSNVHDSDIMAGPDAKFGIPWEKTREAYQKAKEAGITRVGVHMMTGSCVTDPVYFGAITRKLLDIVGPIISELKLTLEFIDIGGGFGIPYLPNEKPLDIEAAAENVVSVLLEKTKQYQLGTPTLFVEPGRYLVGDAGFVLGRVLALKESYFKFVGTDVGMSVLARPVLYDAYHHIHVDDARDESEVVTVTGQACENADAWAKNRTLPKLAVGDLIVVENAGAYGYVMSYPYNGRLRAAEVLVDGTKHQLIRRRETLDDWLSLVP